MAGGKKITTQQPSLEEAFLEVLKEYTAGDPMRTAVHWTNLTRQEIAEHLAEAGCPVSRNIVGQLLEQHDDVQRKAQKTQTMGQHRDRNAQFENIAELKQQYLDSSNPILRMDTKKKEHLGNFYREGKLYTQANPANRYL